MYKHVNIEEIAALLKKYSCTCGILSTVIDIDEELVSYLQTNLTHFIFLDESVKLPVLIEYDTPKTLGKDRIAAIVGANYLMPGKDLLIIDAGTAITYELVESTGVYKGGNISPGMTTRFKALNCFTKRLYVKR